MIVLQKKCDSMNENNKHEDKKTSEDRKTNEEIRKEIEQLEKLIEKVKEQNRKNKKKQMPSNPVLRINLAAVYSRNVYVNLVIGFLINFIAIFLISRLIGHLFFSGAYNDVQLLSIILGLTLFEELYKKVLFKKYMSIVVYSVGTIFFLLNVIYFYLIDYLVFDFRWFSSSYHPVLLVITFVFFRYIIKVIYKRIETYINKRGRR